jgi:hypothetical protein
MSLALEPEEPSIASKDLFPGQEQAVGIFRAFTQGESLRPLSRASRSNDLRLCVRSALRSLLFAMRSAPCSMRLCSIRLGVSTGCLFCEGLIFGWEDGILFVRDKDLIPKHKTP